MMQLNTMTEKEILTENIKALRVERNDLMAALAQDTRFLEIINRDCISEFDRSTMLDRLERRMKRQIKTFGGKEVG